MKTNFCYHTHTPRCGHAYGTDEGYVTEAIANGLVRLGFSDHCMFPGMDEPYMRGNSSLIGDYLESIGSLKNKYQGKVDIYVGFEAENMGKGRIAWLRDMLLVKLDYLILGQHGRSGGTRTDFYGSHADKKWADEQYLHDLLEGMETGLFAYVAHPDLFLEWNETLLPRHIEMAKAIASKAKELDIPLEMNCGYLRRYREWKDVASTAWMHYPYPTFWKVIKESGAKVTLGVDAHAPSDFSHYSFDAVYGLANDLGIEIVEPDIKAPKARLLAK